jgi:hypothetical protein
MTKMLNESETKAVKISSKYGVSMKLVVRATGETLLGPCFGGQVPRRALYRQWSNQLARN